jgi:membrane protein DedA with SNARE-associated domain
MVWGPLPTIPPSRMLIVLASFSDKIVDPIVNVATDFIGSAGVIGVFVLMLLESACIPVPSEAIMLFAGFSVSEGDMTLFGIVAAGVLGNVVGSWIAYAVGFYGRLDLLEKNKLIHISPKHLKWADDWFARYGAATVFFSRMLPIVRTFISLPAGVAKMPFWRFTAYTLAGCIPWVLMLALIGRSVGDNWEHWRHQLGYLDYVVLAAVVGGIVYLLIRRRRGGGEDEPGEGQAVASAELAGTAESL